jgi:hypothetical protein
MTRAGAALALSAVLVACGCGSSVNPSTGELQGAVRQGVADVRSTSDMESLRPRLLATLARIRALRGGDPASRRARILALRGFGLTLRGVESRLAFERNDSGEVAAATRDAVRADRYLSRGAELLRAAGRLLGVPVGTLNGY